MACEGQGGCVDMGGLTPGLIILQIVITLVVCALIIILLNYVLHDGPEDKEKLKATPIDSMVALTGFKTFAGIFIIGISALLLLVYLFMLLT